MQKYTTLLLMIVALTGTMTPETTATAAEASPNLETGVDTWPGWLGPTRDGVWRETNILKTLPPEGPKLRWRTEIGTGYSGPAVVGNRVYLMDRVPGTKDPAAMSPDDFFEQRTDDGMERVLCLDDTDGSIVWKHEYQANYSVAFPAGPRATPQVHDGKVYTLGTQGDLYCLDAQNGQVVWHADFRKDYNLEIPTWGTATQPLIDGDNLICIVGGEGTTAVAFDKDTGKEQWRALSSEMPGYSAPVIYEAAGVRQLIIWHGEAINALNPETGALYWSVPAESYAGMAITTPMKFGNILFVMSFNGNSYAIKLDTDTPTASLLWQGDKEKGIAGVINTPWLEDGYIYGNDYRGIYRCVRLETGEHVWESKLPATGSMAKGWSTVFAVKNGDLYYMTNDIGDLIIAKMNPEGYEELGRHRILDASKQRDLRNVIWSHPAYANRSIYARSDHEIVCYSLAETE